MPAQSRSTPRFRRPRQPLIPDLRQRFGPCMLMPEADDTLRLDMNLCAEDVIEQESLDCVTAADNHDVGLASWITAFSNTHQGEKHFHDSFLFDGRVPLHDTVEEMLSAGHENLNDARCVAVVKDAGVGMEPQVDLVAGDG